MLILIETFHLQNRMELFKIQKLNISRKKHDSSMKKFSNSTSKITFAEVAAFNGDKCSEGNLSFQKMLEFGVK